MPKGYMILVLHAHLPYVRHPEHEHFLEERWLFEAITETYIPLIKLFEDLSRDGVEWRLTMSVTPPLASMLVDPLLQQRYVRHLDNLIELAEREMDRTRYQPEFYRLAEMYRDQFHQARYIFCEQYQLNILNAFKKFQDQGYLELITSGATHGFFPLLGIHREAIRAQVAVAMETHTKFFGRSPQGIWLPECGYHPGDDWILREFGLRHFFTDTHGVLYASKRPKYGIFAPIYCPSGVAAFGRDVESSKQVWSAEEGYPGDYDYRDFYRDIGFDLDFDYIKPYIHPDGIRIHTGMKYYRITGKTNHKEVYIPEHARQKAAIHAGNFMFNREKQIEYLAAIMDRQPLIVSPYDAELFGHWWFEGPMFLNYFIRKVAYDQNVFKLITPSEYLRYYPCNQVAVPNMSSWGNKGYNEVWLEKSNDWIYRHLHKGAERMIELADRYHSPNDLERRALNQAARELLLAQSSDWAFIMKTGTAVDYAIRRTKDHLWNLQEIYYSLKENRLDAGWLSDLENRNNIFPEIDYRVYSRHYRGADDFVPMLAAK
ncbi:MAG: DUF1957 domain-containing protein [Firmicutes bacterium]|nr:DUF1957 domain-containing protein [Bacillota bacterium]